MLIEKKPLVVKSNRLIEASYRLSLVEMRLVLKAAAQARENARGLFPYEAVTIRAIDFAEFFELDKKTVYAQMKEALLSLFNRSVLTRDIDPESGFTRVNHIRWISEASYVDGSGNVQIIFAPSVIPYLTNWFEGEFTRYRLEKIGHLTSVYAVRLYELLLQYKAIGSRSFEISTLRETFGLINEYKLFGHLKDKVIDAAVDQINEHTDIKVKYEARKTGRKITHLDFKIKEKNATTSGRSKLDRAYIDKHARPGETYEVAAARLAAQRDKPQRSLIE